MKTESCKIQVMSIVETKNLKFEYIRRDDEGNVEGITTAIDDVSLEIKQGDFIAILGHNGSGKSTLAKHINAILYPTEGTVWVDGMNTTDEAHLWDIRQEAGMVFQNPDNQIIGQVVEEDVGFGPENLGVPTAMLDPNGRKEVIRAVRALNDVEEITVILITHYMEEIIHADRAIVMDEGKIAMEGTPREIFSQVEKLKSLRLDVPQVTLLAHELKQNGVPLPDGILTTEELVTALGY